jgi:signal transduction histidine kinase
MRAITPMVKVAKSEEFFSLSGAIRAKILNQMASVLIFVLTVYFFLDIFLRLHIHTGVFIGLLSLGIGILFLNANGYFKVATSLGLLFFNLFIYLMSSSERYETGIHLYIVLAGFIALVLFGNENRLLGYLFVFFSSILYLLIVLVDFSLLEYRYFSDDQVKAIFVVNGAVYSVVSIYLLFIVLRLNYKAEENLTIKKIEITTQNEKLKKANLELDRFVYSASHDLRAPLSSISGLITLSHQDPSATPEYLVMMQDRVGVMDKFIREIIDYSRNARLELQLEKINLRKLIEEVVEVLRFTPNREKITIEVKSGDETIISSDRTRLNVVLSNLIANAIKYQDLQKGNSYLIVSCALEGSICRIKLEDNGIGIKEEYQPKIFNMFYRATEKSKGSGLGLYIVKETLDKLSGTISFQSTYGQGTTFEVSIPA